MFVSRVFALLGLSFQIARHVSVCFQCLGARDTWKNMFWQLRGTAQNVSQSNLSSHRERLNARHARKKRYECQLNSCSLNAFNVCLFAVVISCIVAFLQLSVFGFPFVAWTISVISSRSSAFTSFYMLCIM